MWTLWLQKKGMTTNFFSPLSFIAVLGSGIRYPGSDIRDPGWVKSGSGIRDKHPRSATLFLGMDFFFRYIRQKFVCDIPVLLERLSAVLLVCPGFESLPSSLAGGLFAEQHQWGWTNSVCGESLMYLPQDWSRVRIWTRRPGSQYLWRLKAASSSLDSLQYKNREKTVYEHFKIRCHRLHSTHTCL